MAMEHWIEGQRQKGNPEAAAIGQTLLAQFGEIALSATAPAVSSPVETTTIVTNAEYPLTPEAAAETFQNLWNSRTEALGLHFEVTPCLYTEEELKTLESQGKRVSFLPVEVSTQATRHLLGKMFPQMQSYSVQEENSVTNDEDKNGWFDYEARIDAPYTNTNERELNEQVKKDNRRLLTLNEYIVAGQDSKHFTGKYLDQDRTGVRTGSRDDGSVVSAHFNPNGYLDVFWDLRPVDHFGGLGGRSSGVKSS